MGDWLFELQRNAGGCLIGGKLGGGGVVVRVVGGGGQAGSSRDTGRLYGGGRGRVER